jgi:quinol monooxygenase YgiN
VKPNFSWSGRAASTAASSTLGAAAAQQDVREEQEVRAMSELQCAARLKIHDGKLDEFKRLAAKCAELVRTKDTGTLQYELYFNSDNSECLVFERYRDSQALLEHLKNLGDTMAAVLQTCSGSGEVCGTPSPELIEQLKDSPVQVFTPFLAK